MNDYFRISKKTKFVIYGAAYQGALFFDLLTKNGYTIDFFIDKRAFEMDSFCGRPVYSINEVVSKEFEENVIIIAVKNVFCHDEIVSNIVACGYHNIIFKPLKNIKGVVEKEANVISTAYDYLLEGRMYAGKIPSTFSVQKYVFCDRAIIQKEGEYVVLYLPVELAYTEKMEKPSIWSDIPLLLMAPHIGFMRWLEGDVDYTPDLYLRFCEHSAICGGRITITDSWRDNVISNRTDVYNNMVDSYERDYDFFKRNAPYAIWNSKGYFNVLSGKHRMAFLVSKGSRFIPVKVSNEDYYNWENNRLLHEKMTEIKDGGVFKSKAPLEHPYMLDYPCDNKRLFFYILSRISYVISEIQLRKTKKINPSLSVINVNINDDGYLERCLSRFGFVLSNEQAEYAIIDAVDKISDNCRYVLLITEDNINDLPGKKVVKKLQVVMNNKRFYYYELAYCNK